MLAAELLKAGPAVGQRIKFLSDELVDKGPATGTIVDTKITVDGLYVVVEFKDGQRTLSWDDLEAGGADVRGDLWMVKAHVKGHVKHDGTYVRPYERGENGPSPDAHEHPRVGEKGQPVLVKNPHHASAPSTWTAPHAVATFLPDGDEPAILNGVPLRRWRDHPTTDEGWEFVDGLDDDLDEPIFHLPKGKTAASGVVVEEPDGRIWLVAPTNAFGGYKATFPKGGAEPGLSLQANAVKECFEEAGLKVRITGFLGDFERTTSVARMYRAVRVGGCPSSCGWESQAVHLAPKEKMYSLLNGWADHGVAEAVGAGPKPPKPEPLHKPLLDAGKPSDE